MGVCGLTDLAFRRLRQEDFEFETSPGSMGELVSIRAEEKKEGKENVPVCACFWEAEDSRSFLFLLALPFAFLSSSTALARSIRLLFFHVFSLSASSLNVLPSSKCSLLPWAALPGHCAPTGGVG